jgi:hypothetical protein
MVVHNRFISRNSSAERKADQRRENKLFPPVVVNNAAGARKPRRHQLVHQANAEDGTDECESWSWAIRNTKSPDSKEWPRKEGRIIAKPRACRLRINSTGRSETIERHCATRCQNADEIP